MSYRYRGRYTHNYQEYLRWKSEGEREDLRRTNSNLQSEANRLRSELSAARDNLSQAQGDVREAARLQARLEERQHEFEEVQRRIQESQRQYEARAQRRQRELEDEIREVELRNHADIEAAERRANEQIEELRSETAESIAAVQGDVGNLREDMNQKLDEVSGQIQETRAKLQQQVNSVRADLERERHERLAKETRRAGQAAKTVEWIEERMSNLSDLDSLGLHVERTRTQEHLSRAREVLAGDDADMALPVAETASASFQTAYLEMEHRLGIIDGVAEHVRHLADALEQIAAKENFRLIFRTEAEQIDNAVAALRTRADEWVRRKQWTVFEVERETLLPRANQMLARALELEALVPGLFEQLRAREGRLQEAGAAMAAITGAVDEFEMAYANADDVKSPRLLRGRVGQACVDAYLDLDGTYRIDAYGFTSSGQCGEAASRMGRKLEELWHVTEGAVDHDNRQERAIVPQAAEEPWRQAAEDFAQVSAQLNRTSDKR